MNAAKRYEEFRLQMQARMATSDEFIQLKERSIRQIKNLALTVSQVSELELDAEMLKMVDKEFDKTIEESIRVSFMWSISPNLDEDFRKELTVDFLWEHLLRTLKKTLQFFNTD